MKFNDFGLDADLLSACGRLGFDNPTPIQTQAIPAILKGKDVLACAETGTGKTAAFLLPVLNGLFNDRNSNGTKILILSPTRELAIQTETACRAFAGKRVKCVAIIGGTGYSHQKAALSRGTEIVIATPGRLIDLMGQNYVDFASLSTLVLDEADRMLDMGFLPAIRKITAQLPNKRQTLLFSATMARQVERIAEEITSSPIRINVSRPGTVAAGVEQTAYPVAQEFKLTLLLELLEKENYQRVLIFTRTKRGADRIAHILERRAHRSKCIHSDRSQSQRSAALESFRNGSTRVLVATDVAARGIDIDSVSHVINYDVPAAAEDYVHRIGRTGRAGNTGRAITLMTAAEEHSMKAIERLTGKRVQRVILPNFGGLQNSAEPVSVRAATQVKQTFRSFGGRRRR